jgi:hypothetical protein
MIKSSSIARRVLLPKSAVASVVCVIILLCIVPLLVSGVRYLITKSWFVEVSFDGTFGEFSRFVAKNDGRSEQFVRIPRFALSTAKFGKLDWYELDSKIADNGRLVPPGRRVEFSVAVPVNISEYLCSSLRAIGFFAQYGTLKNGRLMLAGGSATVAKKILEDLSCSYDVSNKALDDANARRVETRSNVTPTVRVPCSQVNWISDCVSQVVPFDG